VVGADRVRIGVGKLSGPYIQLFFASRLHNNGHANLIAT